MRVGGREGSKQDQESGRAALCLVIQSCLTLCEPMDCSPPGSSVHVNSPGKNTGVCCHVLLQGIFPTQVSHVAGSFFTVWATRKKKKEKFLSRVWLFAIPWTVAYQASPSMGFSRKEYWSGLLFPLPGGLSDPGIEPRSLALYADALQSEPPGNSPPGKSVITGMGSLSLLQGIFPTQESN